MSEQCCRDFARSEFETWHSLDCPMLNAGGDATVDTLNPYAQRQRCSSGLHEEAGATMLVATVSFQGAGQVVAFRTCKHCRCVFV